MLRRELTESKHCQNECQFLFKHVKTSIPLVPQYFPFNFGARGRESRQIASN